MESEDLQQMIAECPLLIRMNDGHEYFVEKPEFIVVADYTAAILVDDNGVKRNAVIGLMKIATVNTHAPRRRAKA
jgi:uncharacterized protein (UPF0216 family)